MVSELAEELLYYFEDHRDLQDVPAIKNLGKAIRKNDKSTRDKQDFQVEEDLIAIGAIAYMASKYKRYEDILNEGFERAAVNIENGVIDIGGLNSSLERFDELFKVSTMTQKQEQMVYEGMRAAIDRGIRFVTRSTEVVPAVDVDAVLTRSAQNLHWYARESFGRIIVPKVQNTVGQIQADPSKAPAFSELRESIDSFYKKEPYGRIVANSYASRSYNWGTAKSAQAKGYRFYKYRAIIDDRTSDICRELNGKVFDMDRALARLEASIASRETQIEYANPWVKVEDILGKSITEIEDIGANTPPNHANCRSWIEPKVVRV